MFKVNREHQLVLLSLGALLALLLVSGCTQSAQQSPYTGMYQLTNNPSVNVFVTERDNKFYGRNVWGIVELDINEQHRFELKKWNLTGQFSEFKKGKFERYTQTVNGQVDEFHLINTKLPNYKYLYSKAGDFTDFSSEDEKNCSDNYPRHSLTENSKHPEKIEKLIKQIKSDRYSWEKQDSLLVFKDNKLLVEEYFNGWSRDDPHQAQSISKSLTSLLVGSLITEGKLSRVDAPIGDYLPQYLHLLSGDKSKITLENFMNMSAGIEWDEWTVPYSSPDNIRAVEIASDDAVAFTLKRAMTHQPGEHFSYSGGYVSVVGAVIDTATKQPTVANYAQNSVLSKLCFKNAYWAKQNDAKTNTAGGAMMRPIDMLKVGQLMLDDGMWQGKQLMDKQWVLDSMDPALNRANNKYGYFWWRDVSFVDGEVYPVVKALGYGGQEIVIIKDLNLVVVVTASNYEANGKVNEMLSRFIIPAFVGAPQ